MPVDVGLTIYTICEVRMTTIFVWLSRLGKASFSIFIGTIAVFCNAPIGVAQPVPPPSASDLLEEDEETIRVAQTVSPPSAAELLEEDEEDEETIRTTVIDEILNQPVYAPFRWEAAVEDSTR